MPTDTYSTPGTFTWTCPANVYFVDAVVQGGGGGGETDGTPNGVGQSQAGGDSYFVDTSTVCATGGGRGESFGPAGAFAAGDSGFSGGRGWSSTAAPPTGGGWASYTMRRGGGGGAGSGGAGTDSSPDYVSTIGGAGGTGTVPGGKGGNYEQGDGTAPGGGGAGSGYHEGGYGGGCAVKASIPVVPGVGYTVVVGAGGVGGLKNGIDAGALGDAGDGAPGRVTLTYSESAPPAKNPTTRSRRPSLTPA